MRTGLTLTGIAAASLLAAGLIAASPAYAASATASVQDSGAPQYHLSCNSQSTCNTDTTGTLEIQFNRTGSTRQALGIFYQITNGTAVDGTDFNVPATGEVIIPAGQFNQDLAVPLVNEGLFPSTATKAFTIAFTGTSSSSQSLTCNQRPATQVWNFTAECFTGLKYSPAAGNQVTGEGTSTISNCTGLSDGGFFIDS